MTKATDEIVQHRRSNRFGRRIGLALMVGAVVTMLVALIMLFKVQEDFKKCSAQYLADDSAARTARSEASASTINSLVDAFAAVSANFEGADPKLEADARNAITAVPVDAAKYNASIEKFPYPKYTCGGTE
jgi:hypothetical protein